MIRRRNTRADRPAFSAMGTGSLFRCAPPPCDGAGPFLFPRPANRQDHRSSRQRALGERSVVCIEAHPALFQRPHPAPSRNPAYDGARTPVLEPAGVEELGINEKTFDNMFGRDSICRSQCSCSCCRQGRYPASATRSRSRRSVRSCSKLSGKWMTGSILVNSGLRQT